jgi:hypothetical protein
VPEPGLFYEVAHPSPTATALRRKVVVLHLVGECWAEVRQPETGLVSMVTREKLLGPVEPVIVTPETCALCGGEREVPVMRVVAGEPWRSLPVGVESCPNCSTDS